MKSVRRSRTALIVLLVGALAAMLAACSAPRTSAPETTDPGSSPQSPEDYAWSRVTNQYPDAQRPEVDVVRVVTPSEWAPAVVACLAEDGFEAEALADGGIRSEVTGEQGEAYAIAYYTCTIRYPIDPKYLQPLNDDQLAVLYAYTRDVLAPCLESFGLVVPDAPTLEVFVENKGVAAWNVYADVPTKVTSDEMWQEISAKCPQYPPDLFG